MAYDANSSVVPKVREACAVEQRLTTDIGSALSANGGPGTTTSTAGEVVRVVIVDVMGVGGGAWSGPKAISIRVDIVRVNATAARSFAVNSQDRGRSSDR